MNISDRKNKLLKLKGIDLEAVNHIEHYNICSSPSDPLITEIYKVNPSTGLPDNDLRMLNNPNVSVTLRNAIGNMQKKIDPTAPSSFDGDVILDANQNVNESNEEYLNRIKDDTDKYLNDSVED